MERDFANEYDEWLRLTGGDGGNGGTIPTEQYVQPPPAPAPTAAAAPPKPAAPAAPTRPPKPTSAPDGYEWVDAYDGGWELKRITDGRSWDGRNVVAGGSDGGAFVDPGGEPAAFNWSQFNPAKYRFDNFISTLGPYAGPTMQEAENEPGYQFSRDQGRDALESSAAGRGVLRTGGTLKDILKFGDSFGAQNYDAVDNRKFRNWNANIDNEFRAYGVNRDTYTTQFDRNYRGEKDSFDALHDSESRNFADQYSRWKSRLDSLTQIATAGMGS